jgi:hypothetical protein
MSFGTSASTYIITRDERPGVIVRYLIHLERGFNPPLSGSCNDLYHIDHLRLSPPPQFVHNHFRLQKRGESR